MSSSPSSSSTVESPTEPTTGNRLSSLDPSKKYTLVFLISVGTTLLLTGASGGRLLKRAKKVTAEPVPHQPLPTKLAAPEPIPIPRAPLSPFNPPTSALDSYTLSADPSSLRRAPKLRSFRLDSSTAAGRAPQTAYFLPNVTLLAQSTAFAEALDKQDRLHKDGEEQPEALDDGFNPAVYAAKAFGIATALTVGTFAAGIYGVMKWLQVDDLESLSLALSHRLPSSLPHPTLPSWALPTPSSPSDIKTPGAEEDSLEHKEGVAYWVGVKETLDREAGEREVERRRRWEGLVKARKGRQV